MPGGEFYCAANIGAAGASFDQCTLVSQFFESIGSPVRPAIFGNGAVAGVPESLGTD